MKADWLPVSAALFLTGALAVALGSLLLPSSEDSSDTLRIVQDQGGVWMAAAAAYFLASVFLTLGMPSVLTLFEDRGRVLGMIGTCVLEFGFIGLAGYAMLMVFFRALVVTDAIVDKSIDAVTDEIGLQIFLFGWIVAFFLGEALLAVALLRARTVALWVPILLLVHVSTLFVSSRLPEWAAKGSVLLLVAAFAGIAIQATSPASRSRLVRSGWG